MTKGEILKRLRMEKDISLEEIGNLIGTSKQTVYKYENDIVTNIPSDKIELLSDIYNVSPAYIMGWEQNKCTKDESLLINKYNALNLLGKKEALKRVSELAEIDKYTTKLTLAAHNDDTSEDQIDLMLKDFEEMDKW